MEFGLRTTFFFGFAALAGAWLGAACGGSDDGHQGFGGAGSGGTDSAGVFSSGTSTMAGLGGGGPSMCPGKPPTTIKGTVYAPNGVDPLYHATVYVPTTTVDPFPQGVQCLQCGNALSGNPAAQALTDTHGNFTLTNAPCGADIPLVIQVGKWRRQVKLPKVDCCVDNALSDPQVTRLPKNQSEGDIPLMAFATGKVDALECVFRKIGVDDSEFSVPTSAGGKGRIQFFMTTAMGVGADIAPGAPAEDVLWADPMQLNQYDVVFLPCEGGPFPESPQAQQNLIAYADAGGRIFATHYSYVWMYKNAWAQSGDWSNVDQPAPPDLNGIINTSFQEGADLAAWLQNIGATKTEGTIPVQVVRHDLNSVDPNFAQEWIRADSNVSPNTILHMTFNTPIGADPMKQCGRVLYDDFHVEDADTSGQTFPDECSNDPMTPQEKLLMFLIYDLSSCIMPMMPPK